MFGEFEDAHESDNSQESQRSTGLGGGTAHGGKNVEEGDVVRDYCCYVDEVLESEKKHWLGGARYEPDKNLDVLNFQELSRVLFLNQVYTVCLEELGV